MIILASKSPRRKELLSFITDDFKVDSADVDETLPQNIKPDKAVEYLSKIKAEPFRSSDNIVIGADTVVAIGDKILGKPKDKHDAFLMLKSLSGKEHSVFTGVTIKPKLSAFKQKLNFLNFRMMKSINIFQQMSLLIKLAHTVFRVKAHFLLKKLTVITSM